MPFLTIISSIIIKNVYHLIIFLVLSYVEYKCPKYNQVVMAMQDFLHTNVYGEIFAWS